MKCSKLFLQLLLVSYVLLIYYLNCLNFLLWLSIVTLLSFIKLYYIFYVVVGEPAEDVSAEASASVNEVSEAVSQPVAGESEEKLEPENAISETPLTGATSSAEVVAPPAVEVCENNLLLSNIEDKVSTY